MCLGAPYHERVSTWFFDFLAPWYERLTEPLMLIQPAQILSVLQLEGHERILDLAGGTGQLARAIVSSSKAHVTILDASQKMLDQIEPHPRIHPILGVANSLPFHAETFDWVVCTTAFHLLTPHAATLMAMRRVLKQGGRIFLLDFDRNGLLGPLLTQSEALLHLGSHYLSASEVAEMMKDHGFSGQITPFNLFQFAFVGLRQD